MPPRATLCDPANSIHNWFSIGPTPTDPQQLCDCKALRREQADEDEKVKHSPSIFVNGVKIVPESPENGGSQV